MPTVSDILALWLLVIREVTLDVPTTSTARVRELSRGGRRKNDRIDAAAAACVAALQSDARPVAPEGPAEILGLRDERRTNLSNSRNRSMKQLHALLRQLLAEGAPTSLTASAAAATKLPHQEPCRPDAGRAAQHMIERALDAQVPFSWATADEAYGQVKYLRVWPEERDVSYVLATRCNDDVIT